MTRLRLKLIRGLSPVFLAVAVVVMAAAPAPATIAAAPQAAGSEAASPPPRLVHEEAGISFYALEGDTTNLSRRVVEGLDYATLSATARETTGRVERLLGLPPGGPMRVLLVPSRGVESEGSSLLSLPRWAAGAAYGPEGDIVLVVGRAGSYPDRDLPGVLAHECAHVVLDRALASVPLVDPGGRPRPGEGDAAGAGPGPGTSSSAGSIPAGPPHVPRWFKEGFAVLEAHPWGWKDALQLATTVVWDDPPPLETLDRSFPVTDSEAATAYAVSLSAVAWMQRTAGEEAPARIVRAVAAGATFDQALRQVLGLDPAAMEAAWRGSAQLRYRWIPILTSSSAIWTLILGLLFVAGARRRARRRELERLWGERVDIEPDTDGEPESGTGSNGHDRWVN